VFAHVWATKRLSFLADDAAFGTVSGALRFFAGLVRASAIGPAAAHAKTPLPKPARARAQVAIPLWRDFHFYFAHRLLHFGPVFRHVHSLHHRNTDIEPFAGARARPRPRRACTQRHDPAAGLCMHPVEHLYYYACVLPSLVFFASPFHLLWNGLHLLLAPGASHSGRSAAQAELPPVTD
jgi:sterol desaturase/sphingolipid hydroxylase (fatty acid hydroxylase superfamily)